MWVLSLHWTFLMRIILFHYDIFITLEYKQDTKVRRSCAGRASCYFCLWLLRKRRECELRCKNSLLCYEDMSVIYYRGMYELICIYCNRDEKKTQHILIIWGTFYITILCVNLYRTEIKLWETMYVLYL